MDQAADEAIDRVHALILQGIPDRAAAARVAEGAYARLLAATAEETGRSVVELDREAAQQVRAFLDQRHAEEAVRWVS